MPNKKIFMILGIMTLLVGHHKSKLYQQLVLGRIHSGISKGVVVNNDY